MADPVVFWIDHRDRIAGVNDAWTPFALENDAPELAGQLVINRSLWDFVVDATTRHLYSQIIARARDGAVVTFPLRCDSPGRRRHLEMTVGARPGAGVQFETRLLSATERPAQTLLERGVPRSSDLVTMCSWCKRVEVAGDWQEVEQAVERLGLFDVPQPPTLTHGICPGCMDMVDTVIDRLR